MLSALVDRVILHPYVVMLHSFRSEPSKQKKGEQLGRMVGVLMSSDRGVGRGGEYSM